MAIISHCRHCSCIVAQQYIYQTFERLSIAIVGCINSGAVSAIESFTYQRNKFRHLQGLTLSLNIVLHVRVYIY